MLRSLIAKATFKYKNQNKKMEAKEHAFGFVNSSDEDHLTMKAHWDLNTLLSSDLFEMNSLYFIVEIEIIKVFTWSQGSVPIYK